MRGEFSEILGILASGSEISGSVEDGWVKIIYNGQIGYISESFVSETGTSLTEDEISKEAKEKIAQEKKLEEAKKAEEAKS